MVGKRHASDEVAAKLAQADELAAKGKTQREIAKTLGVSIMTYHRWKKVPRGTGNAAGAGDRDKPEVRPDMSNPVRQLELENAQLRRLVTDLLLEKLKLEQEVGARREARLGPADRPSRGR